MELRHLRHFVALASELNFSAAAGRLGISQSALSQQIVALERELGIKLVSRSARKTGLTRAGHVFLDAARRILDDAEAPVASARATAQGVGPNLTIGMSGFAPRDFLNWLEETNRERDLGLSTLLRVLSLQRIFDDLQANKLDIGLIRLPLPNSILRHKVILHDPLVALISRRHPLAAQGALPLNILRNETF